MMNYKRVQPGNGPPCPPDPPFVFSLTCLAFDSPAGNFVLRTRSAKTQAVGDAVSPPPGPCAEAPLIYFRFFGVGYGVQCCMKLGIAKCAGIAILTLFPLFGLIRGLFQCEGILIKRVF